MGANATNAGIDRGDGLEATVKLAAGSGGGATVETSGAPAAASNAPIGPARALWIYLKHRGVLNVDEFRRTNARGL